jgi:uncharacterized SAM-binding protein YcdF (DUF218 family)
MTRQIGLAIIAAIVLAYVAGFIVFVSSLPKPPDNVHRADGIVALTGGDARLITAESLFESGVGKRLLISGVHPETTRTEIKQLVHGGARFDCCVDLGFEATNTHGNAMEAADWARTHHFHSLVVVTANYHMPRSLLEFADVMPDTKLIPYPVEQTEIDPQAWWNDSRAFRVLQWEYVKYMGSLVTTMVSSAVDPSYHHRSAGRA